MAINIKDNGINNIIKIPKNIDYEASITINGNDNYIEISDNTKAENIKILIEGDKNNITSLGKRLGNIRLTTKKSSSIFIDELTTIESAYLLADEGKKIKIGKDCMLSFNIQFRTTDAHSIFDLDSKKRINLSKDITIEDHVWINQACLISKGSNIKKNSIIGAQSFTQNNTYPPFSIIAGTPAKVVRYNVIWDRKQVDEINLDYGMDSNFKLWYENL